MPHWSLLRSCCALSLFASLHAGCGGSSSETPFPLEPDPSQLKPGAPPRARYVALPRREPGAEPRGNEAPDQELPSTWGKAPSVSSPEPPLEEPEPPEPKPELKNGR